MNKLDLLRTRRTELLDKSKEIREKISAVVDENSFVELDAYSFSRNEFYGEDAQGEGVVTGLATIDDTTVCVVAQNAAVLSGGVTKANCDKITKCLTKALETGSPVVWFFDSLGVSVGEGVNVMEGMAEVISLSETLKGEVPQFSVVTGKLYGTFALLAANADFNFMLSSSLCAYASPAVLSAKSGKKLAPEEVAGAKASKYNEMNTLSAESLADVRAKIVSVLSILPAYSEIAADTEDDLNRTSEGLNEKVCPDCLVKAVCDNGDFIETNKDFCPEVKTGICRIGGISSAVILFGNGSEAAELTFENILKIKHFANFAYDYDLPLVTFVNTLGLKTNLETSNTVVLKEICNLVSALKGVRRLSVVTGKAVGLGYTLFAAKNLGVDYSYAFATGSVALFDGKESAVCFGEIREDKLEEFSERYAEENADPINAAKGGFIDNIIEPAFVRPYVISALQTLVK